MKPDYAAHNDSAQYATELIKSTGMTPPELKAVTGIDERTLRRYKSGERPFPYSIQFMLEAIVLEP